MYIECELTFFLNLWNVTKWLSNMCFVKYSIQNRPQHPFPIQSMKRKEVLAETVTSSNKGCPKKVCTLYHLIMVLPFKFNPVERQLS